jgi:hypothetical protein
VSYAVEGLSNLPFLNPLPVVEDLEISDVGAMARGRVERSNGTYVIERQIQRPAAALQSGALRWTVKVHGYGLDPEDVGLTIQFRPGQPPEPHPADTPCQRIPGLWSWFINGDVTFRADGSLTQGQLTGRWSCSNSDRTVTITWSHGFTDHLVVSADGTRLSGSNNVRNGVSGQRKADLPGPKPPPKPEPWWYVICGGDVMRTPLGPPAGDRWMGTYPSPSGGPGWVFDLRKSGNAWAGDGHRFGQSEQNKTPCHAEIR